VSYSRNRPPLGAVLQQAGLVSAEQVNQALKQQKQTNSSLKIGEILAIQGRIDPQTANFFAERWDGAISEQPKQPIGHYLKQAALLNERQIQAILLEQKNSERKFGELAIAKGWLKQTTLDFFLRYLQSNSNPASANLEEQQSVEKATTTVNAGKSYLPKELKNGAIDEKQDYSQKVHEGFLQIKRKLLKIEGQDNYSEKTLERVLSWTGGHSLLTQKIFALIAQGETPLSLQEEEQVDYLVQTKIVDNWSSNELQLHLRGIKERLINNQHCPPDRLLLLYQKVLMGTALIDGSLEQQELLSLGLAVKQQARLVVANRIYQSVFNLTWVVETLNHRVRLGIDRGIPISKGNNSSNAVVASSSPGSEPQDSWLNLKNILLLLTLIGLSGISVDNIFKRVTVRKSFRQGNEFLKQKSFEEAVDEYNRLLEIDSNYFQAWTNRGYALAGLQKYEAMRQSCLTATIIHPEAVYGWNCQGEALHNLKKYSEAVKAFDRAIALNNTDPIFSINKSESLRALGENEASIKSVQQAIGALEQIEALEGSDSIQGEFAVALTLLGNNSRQAESFNKAIAAYDRAIRYSPNYFPARIGKGITLDKAKRHSEAEFEFRQMLKDSELSPIQEAQTWFYLGKTQCKSARYADGVESFERAIELNPDYAIAKDAKQQCR